MTPIFLCALVAGDVATAQERAPTPSGPVQFEAIEPFTRITGVVELSNGFLLVSDRGEGTLSLVHLQNGTRRVAATRGRGPTEFLDAGGLYRVGPDEVWMSDALLRRFLRLSLSGERLGTEAEPALTMGYSTSQPHADGQQIDGARRIYRRAAYLPSPDSVPKQAPLVRSFAGRTDTLLWLNLPPIREETLHGRRVLVTQVLGPSDGFTVAADGAVAIVRADPYRVEWMLPNGRYHIGPRIATTTMPVTADARAAALEEREARTRAASGTEVRVRDGRGREAAVPASQLIARLWMAERMPPFVEADLRVAPDGHLWVHRNVPSSAGAVYDVFDRTSTRVARVLLPERTHLVGFGNGALYVARTDEDGLQRLGKIAWPRR